MQVNNSVTTNVIVPVLETERLYLRAFTPGDLDTYHAMSSDPNVVRYLQQDIVLSRELAWQSLAYLLGHWQMTGFGSWAVEEKTSGQLIGRVGLYAPLGWPEIELGWMIARSHWQQGFAFEAAQAAMSWCERQADKQQLISLIHPKNIPSINLAAKLGARFIQEIKTEEFKTLQFAFDLQKSSGTLNAK